MITKDSIICFNVSPQAGEVVIKAKEVDLTPITNICWHFMFYVRGNDGPHTIAVKDVGDSQEQRVLQDTLNDHYLDEVAGPAEMEVIRKEFSTLLNLLAC